jgi:Rps23 Pro-64 3,4-dihydroxylase Tpa1-like proline 4-hydroxylase
VKTPPYPNVALDNFLPQETISAMKQECNNLEWTREFTRNGSHMIERQDVENLPVANEVRNIMSSRRFLVWLGEVTGHHDLIPDPHMIGAGYMRCSRGDSLKLHSDFNFNNTLKLYRMLSINIYLNENWQPEWNGDLQFWDFERKECKTRYFPEAGKAVIFRHHKFGFHGHPEPLQCPENIYRDGFRMFYYVSEMSNYKLDKNPHRSLYWYDEKNKQPYDVPEQE